MKLKALHRHRWHESPSVPKFVAVMACLSSEDEGLFLRRDHCLPIETRFDLLFQSIQSSRRSVHVKGHFGIAFELAHQRNQVLAVSDRNNRS